jgi:hypothetical protein
MSTKYNILIYCVFFKKVIFDKCKKAQLLKITSKKRVSETPFLHFKIYVNFVFTNFEIKYKCSIKDSVVYLMAVYINQACRCFNSGKMFFEFIIMKRYIEEPA